MRFFVFSTDVLAREMSIYLSSRDTRVAQKLLDMPQRRATAQEMGRKAVAQRVRCNPPLNARLLC